MKLYGNPMSCALASHITAREAGIALDHAWVHLATKQTVDGEDYRAVNPKGAVPALVLEDGHVLTEGAAVMQYLADRKPESGLAPPAGSMARYRLAEWLSYLGSELHKKIFYFLFNPLVPAAGKQFSRSLADKELGHLDSALADRDYLLGETFTVADAYLITILNWCGFAGISLDGYPALSAYQQRVLARPAVAAAVADELATMQAYPELMPGAK